MKRTHLILGIIMVVVFLLTGQYMEYVHNRELPDGARVLYRSRHIYILLNALINISLRLVYTISTSRMAPITPNDRISFANGRAGVFVGGFLL